MVRFDLAVMRGVLRYLALRPKTKAVRHTLYVICLRCRDTPLLEEQYPYKHFAQLLAVVPAGVAFR